MKRAFCALILSFVLFLGAMTCLAESAARAGIGVELGIGVGQFDYKSPLSNWNPEPALVYSFGVTKDFVLNNRFAFESSVSYVRLKSDVEVKPISQPPEVVLPGGNFSIYQNSIDFTLVLKAYMHKKLRYYGALGGQVGALLSADQEVTEIVQSLDGQVAIQNTSIDLSNSLKEADFSIVLAVGAELMTASGPDFRWDLQFTHGIIESTKSYAGVRWKRRDIKLAFGLLF